MKKLLTFLATFAMLCSVGCEEQGGDVNPDDKPNTEQPSDNPNGGGNENEQPSDKPEDGNEEGNEGEGGVLDTQEQYKIYAYNLFGWDSVYIYVWDKENLTEYAGKWCGTKMTETEEINGHIYLVYELPKEARGRDIGVIFNNGQGTQTPDWFVTLDEDCYMLLLGTYPTIIQDKNNPTGNDYTDLDKIPDTHKIYYTSTDGNIVESGGILGANLIYNYIILTPSEIKGVMVFDGAVTSVGDGAFQYCSNLATITIPKSVTSIGNWAFYFCSSLTDVTIGDGVVSIGEYAFCDCDSLVSVNIPENVTSIGDFAFSDCDGLAKFNGKFASEDGKCLIVNGKLFTFAKGCGLMEYTIPEVVDSVGGYAFSGCSNLTNISIPKSVTSIGDGAFYGCSSLASVTIPEGVTSIGKQAFHGCLSLESVSCKPTIPPHAHYSCEHSLGGCNDCDLLWSAFYNYSEEFGIYVPAGSVNEYKTARGWKYYEDYIK